MELTPAARERIFTFYPRFSTLEPSNVFQSGFRKLNYWANSSFDLILESPIENNKENVALTLKENVKLKYRCNNYKNIISFFWFSIAVKKKLLGILTRFLHDMFRDIAWTRWCNINQFQIYLPYFIYIYIKKIVLYQKYS